MITKDYLLELLDGSESLEEAAEKLADEVYTYTFQDHEDLKAMFFAGVELATRQFKKVRVDEWLDEYETSKGERYACGIKCYDELIELPAEIYVKKKGAHPCDPDLNT